MVSVGVYLLDVVSGECRVQQLLDSLGCRAFDSQQALVQHQVLHSVRLKPWFYQCLIQIQMIFIYIYL